MNLVITINGGNVLGISLFGVIIFMDGVIIMEVITVDVLTMPQENNHNFHHLADITMQPEVERAGASI